MSCPRESTGDPPSYHRPSHHQGRARPHQLPSLSLGGRKCDHGQLQQKREKAGAGRRPPHPTSPARPSGNSPPSQGWERGGK